MIVNGYRFNYNYFVNNKVKLKEEEDNKIFPASNRASEILYCLLDNLKRADIKYHQNVIDIRIIED